MRYVVFCEFKLWYMFSPRHCMTIFSIEMHLTAFYIIAPDCIHPRYHIGVEALLYIIFLSCWCFTYFCNSRLHYSHCIIYGRHTSIYLPACRFCHRFYSTQLIINFCGVCRHCQYGNVCKYHKSLYEKVQCGKRSNQTLRYILIYQT